MLKVSLVVGNPRRGSRTLQIASRFLDGLLGGVPNDRDVFDLADYSRELFDWQSPVLTGISSRVASSELIVIASPTYKATYTGLLKAFLDRYPADGLKGAIAIPLMTGADATHALGADCHLSPLLAELGAIVPGRGLYFVTNQSTTDNIDDLVSASVKDVRRRLEALCLATAPFAGA